MIKMENKGKTGERIKEILHASINQIVSNVVERAVLKVKETLCRACPTPCDGWCDKATEAAKALINHYIIYKARWN